MQSYSIAHIAEYLIMNCHMAVSYRKFKENNQSILGCIVNKNTKTMNIQCTYNLHKFYVYMYTHKS